MSRSKFVTGRLALAGALLLGVVALPASGAEASTAAASVAATNAQDAAATLAAGLQALNDLAAASAAALAAGDPAGARQAYASFDSGWEAIEDGVRERSRDDYRSIEDAMREVDRGLRADPVDAGFVTQWLTELQNRVNSFIATLPSS
ncbi:MAG TPA: hypothetical protein VFE37_09940 [Chloroflexota bacterium]|nr:hypothetical protein [Chloroflexota bacterium]